MLTKLYNLLYHHTKLNEEFSEMFPHLNKCSKQLILQQGKYVI